MYIVVQNDLDGLITDKITEVQVGFFIFFLLVDCSNLVLNSLIVTTSLTLRSRPSY